MKMLRLQSIGYRSENQIVSAQLAFDSTIMILETAEIPSRINGMFVPSVTNGLSWRVKLHQEGLWQQVDLYHPFLNFHFVQKIDEQRLLLVAARVKNSLVHNACIYSMEGQLLSEFALDDAIQSVDVTEGGSVWVSYFDEGIFGNGILAPFGFIKTDLKGNVLWTAEKFAICDCYAVNIDRETSSWFYYYSDFKLVHIHGEKTVTYSPKIEGACCFAVLDNYILMQGGSDNRQKFILFEIKGRRLHKLGEITFGDRHGKALIQASYAIRGSHVLVSTKNDIFYGQIGYSDLF